MHISKEYLEMNQKLHAEQENFGVSGQKWAGFIDVVASDFSCASILDYGCGKQTLAKSLPERRVIGFDPAIPELSAPPGKADFVVCGDVLEHIEKNYLDDVLSDLNKLANVVAFVVISTREAAKKLSDGRNAHLIVRSPHWWLERLEKRFQVLFYYVDSLSCELAVLLAPRGFGRRLAYLKSMMMWQKISRSGLARYYFLCDKASGLSKRLEKQKTQRKQWETKKISSAIDQSEIIDRNTI